MNIVEFKGQTEILNPPEGWDQSKGLQVGMLPIVRHVHDEIPMMSSFWRPTAEELEQLAAGAHVRLTVIGRGHPPVALEVMKCEELP